MAGAIKAVIFLAIIGGVIFGAKTFYFDPMKQEQQLADMKSELRKLMDAGETEKALVACDNLQKRDPKLKKFCNGRRHEIYKEIGETEWESMMEEERRASKAGKTSASTQKEHLKAALQHTDNIIDAVENIEKYGELTKVHQGWLITAYGFRVQKMGLTDEKSKLKAAQARSKELPSGGK